MCKHPIILAPFKGLVPEYSSLRAISPGISLSAIEISFLPNSASDMSFTLKSSMGEFYTVNNQLIKLRLYAWKLDFYNCTIHI